MLKKKCSPFEAMLNQILLYAKYDITMDDGIPDEYVQTLEDCVFVIDDMLPAKWNEIRLQRSALLMNMKAMFATVRKPKTYSMIK